MGLDMYLYEEIYVGAHYEHRGVTGEIDLQSNGKKIMVPFNKVSSIVVQRGYWRKANAIHSWFVREVQGGVDKCQRSYVSCEKLKELKYICVLIVSADNWQEVAKNSLETAQGFFFGSQEYDEWYLQDIKDTLSILEDLPLDGEFYYQASW